MTEAIPRTLVTIKEASQSMGMSVMTLRRILARDVFTVTTPTGHRGTGSKIFLRVDEVEIFVRQGEKALLEFRRSTDRADERTRRRRKARKS